MILETKISGKRYRFNPDRGVDVSIPLVFNGAQPNSYNVPEASSVAYEDGDFIGDTRRGGGCNFEKYSFIPHCNGTHTECVGHISLARIPVNVVPPGPFVPATLISVAATSSGETTESYLPEKTADDMLITAGSLEERMLGADADFLEGLLIRTLPNDDSKKTRRYMQEQPPFFSLEAMALICAFGVRHLLIDLPSVDRTFDEGRLSAHHIFWGVPDGSHEVDPEERSLKTITEMIYVDDSVGDGKYLLNLQIPNFTSDAAPSRPLLLPLI